MHSELLQIVVKSDAFAEGETIPVRYTADSDDVSPPLTWSGVPHEAKSLALVCEDPDAPRGTFTHWVLFNLPPETRQFTEGIAPPAGAVQGTNDYGKLGYGGPSPPPGKPHRYYFKLFALDGPLDLPSGAKRADLLKAIEGRIVAQGQHMGRYGRQQKG
jgi:Raf kinase inhibitor-like YbhB/YbcL family protein